MSAMPSSSNIRAMNWAVEMREQLKPSEPGNQDRRIAELKKQLRSLMGQESFTEFYKTTSFNGEKLEKQLLDQLNSLVARGFSA